MSIYQTFDSNMANYEIPKGGVPGDPGMTDRDIDGVSVYQDNGNNYYDYEVLSRPTVSGMDILVPSKTDNGMPGLVGDSSATLGSAIDIVNNGRMNDINIINDKFLDKGEADIIINKDDRVTSIKGLVESTSLSDFFFSDMNYDIIQQTIRYNVYNETDKVISDQSKNELYIIMRSIMLQYGNFGVSIDNLSEEIKKLNKQVVDYSSKNIISNVIQYLGYIKDIEKLAVPMDRPAYEGRPKNASYDISNLL